MTTPYPGPGPTLRHLKSMGLTGARVDCTEPGCQHSGRLTWEALPFPDETPFPEIEASQRLRCSKCGSKRVTLMPDWTGYRPQGGG